MGRRSCDGRGLLAAFRGAAAALDAHAEEVDALNVFPVPDGDTGGNMVATVMAAVAQADRLDQPADAGRVADAISFGALMGSRGNSGVITSQILRGMAVVLGGRSRFGGAELAAALTEGANAAYRAVARPVEGTILTVIREAAEAAVRCAEDGGDVQAVLRAAVDEAEASVGRTPALLPVLRDAGVVDSGGQGLLWMLRGALQPAVAIEAHAGTTMEAPKTPAAAAPAAATPAAATPAAAATAADAREVLAYEAAAESRSSDGAYGYETVCLLEAQPGSLLDVGAIREALQELGESVLVAGDSRTVKIHVHNQRPDAVLAYALDLGVISHVSVENLDHQISEAHEHRLPGAAGATLSVADRRAVPLAVVAVVAGAGFEAIYRDFGVNEIVRGGPAANPSTRELLTAIRNVDAQVVILLPNHLNVVLAARQAATLAERPVHVVPTRNAAEGVAALLVLDPAGDVDINVDAMTRAARQVQTLAITEAVRDSTIAGRAIKQGQTMALDPDDGLVVVDSDPGRVVQAAVASLQPGYELLTIYHGDGSSAADAEALAERLRDQLPRVEVEVVSGGQRLYRYLIAAE